MNWPTRRTARGGFRGRDCGHRTERPGISEFSVENDASPTVTLGSKRPVIRRDGLMRQVAGDEGLGLGLEESQSAKAGPVSLNVRVESSFMDEMPPTGIFGWQHVA
ncbi:hypothetical protein CORC01_11811 [Colletotrichum orchidophilum]|uniref:Uncharacterized protein n=1 Tax=Colletotrichum orchidophilum TaxID=1209926 RepID=A0A1G4AUL7_9PEZI|nr:uncharacterized protein CORC01_11811 [Colletotrichum orchidophilum]OHE92869.1 hypothetical protein CORC01_11811 [Colletotrichum orchidophilum]